MAYENTDKLGYVTEKILQAKTAGCIPIYWGHEYVLVDFNPDSFVYVKNYRCLQDLLEYIKVVDNNESLYNKYYTSPMFNYNIEKKYEDLKCFVKKMISL